MCEGLPTFRPDHEYYQVCFFFPPRSGMASWGLSRVKFLEDTYSSSISRVLKLSYWKGKRPHCSSSLISFNQKGGRSQNRRLPIGLYSSDGHAIVSFNQPKASQLAAAK